MATSGRQTIPARRRERLAAGRLATCALFVLIGAALILPGGSAAEQASGPTALEGGQIDAGANHTCALLDGNVRCWGFSREGQLGYGNTQTIGDNETPAGAGAVNLGQGRTAVAISAGEFHTCAILDAIPGDLICWGFNGNGRLGYPTPRPSTDNVGDNEVPGDVGPVDLGGRKVKAIAAGGAHTCAILDDDTVRCWGYGFYGQLGYGNPPPLPGTPTVEPDPVDIGDDENPGDVGPVNLGEGRTAKAITAGNLHTCAILDNDALRCWGNGANGQLGYGNQANVGDRDPPNFAPTVDVGGPVKAVSAGVAQTCALLADAAGSVRCWGFAGNGRLGYGPSVTTPVGDNEVPSSVGPLSLGGAASAVAVGDGHACALLDLGRVRCWGFNIDGRLGYGHRNDIGDDELPSAAGPVDLGAGRSARAIALGARHTIARLDDGDVRAWGYGGNGRLGYCSEANIGDNEVPGAVGPVNLGVPGRGAPGCPPATGPPSPAPAAPAGPASTSPLQAEAARRRAYVTCLRTAARHTRREIGRARRMSAGRRARARRHIKRHRSRMRSACVRRYGRKPGRVTGLTAKAVSRSRIVLTFKAPGSDGNKPPAARTYVVKQSRRPIRNPRDFRRARSLCKGGRCRFAAVANVNAPIELTVEDLRRRTTYYYAVAARDNVSGRLGRRSKTVKVRTSR